MSPARDELLKIGDFAKLAGTNLRTLRYYEEQGLMQPADRSEGRFRYYRAVDAQRVMLIRQLQELGMQLDAIAAFLPSRSGGEERVKLEDVQEALKQHQQLLAQKQRELAAQGEKVSEALTKIAECQTACDQAPSAENKWCEVCVKSGFGLPDLLSALF